MSIYLLSLEVKEFTKLWTITSDGFESASSIGLLSIKVHGNFRVPWA